MTEFDEVISKATLYMTIMVRNRKMRLNLKEIKGKCL